MRYHWQDLGTVIEPGPYRVNGLGVIEVIREDIQRAEEMGGNPALTLQDSFIRKGRERAFDIRFMRP